MNIVSTTLDPSLGPTYTERKTAYYSFTPIPQSRVQFFAGLALS